VLPKFYKVRCYNDAGVSVTVQADWLPYTFASGAPAYHAKVTPIASGAVSSAAAATSAAIDNSTALDVGVSMRASVQDKGSRYEDRAGVGVSVVDYRVSFQVDPATVLPRGLRAGDLISWGAITLTAIEPARDKTGLGWMWRVKWEYVKS